MPAAVTGGGADPGLISVAEAAEQLGVKPSTVYAYVSRGLLRSKRLAGDRRSWLSRAEVDAMAVRSGARAEPLEPTTPGETTRVASIVEDRLYYREHEAAELAATHSFEAVAELLWESGIEPDVPWALNEQAKATVEAVRAAVPESSLPLDRLKVTTAMLGAADSFRYDLSAPSVRSVGRSLVPALVESLPELSSQPLSGAVAARLWSRLSARPARERDIALLSAALVMLGDHAVAPSTRAVRAAASMAADPYSVVLAGMSVASGLLLDGGSSLAVQAWLGDIDSPASVRRVIGERLLRGDRISGFGQPRYERTDGRATLLLDMLAEDPPDDDRLQIVQAVTRLVEERRQLPPNVEFALGALCFVHDMPYGSGEAVFVVARSVGWLAHAIEIYESGRHG